ncbi:MAG: choice-of-anchor D domain-containing protein [Gammaproteobacteria bacterium]|nr:choice-of-anchor D domain-containing protein [Gammaproteobacteria bacterium]
MKTRIATAVAALVLGAATTAVADPVQVDVTSPANGFTDLFSATFDGALSPCAPSDPAWCAFFNGKPGVNRNIVITPTPTGAINAVPIGITPVPAAGSYLDITVNPGRTQVTLAGGTIAVPAITLTIQGGTPNSTVVAASGAGVVFDAAPQVASLDANGVGEFLVNLAPATAVDFSTFSIIVGAPNGSCAGPLCAIIPILTLDMVRYRLLIDFDPTFTTFTASFIGQTGNNSILSIQMNSAQPEIAVTDTVAPATDLSVPFGDVTELTTATRTVTVTNQGGVSLVLGGIGLANSLAPPFALASDSCSAATLAPAATCTFNVTFLPDNVGSFSDTLDIPSNDADEASVTLAVSGNGTALPVPSISVTDSVAPATDQNVPFGSTAIGTTLTRTVTVANEGNADLVIGTLTGLAPPFSLGADNCSGQTVAPAGSCTVDVDFSPAAVGAASDSLDIPSNDASTPVATVTVSGTGTSTATPDISVTDNTLPADDLLVPFGNVTEGTTRDRTVTVTNAGGLNLVIGAVAGSNPVAAPFSIVSDDCSSETLAPGGSCIITLRYAPPATGSAADTLDIPSNDPDEATVTVSLTGTGITLGEGGVEPEGPGGGGGMGLDPASLALLGGLGLWGWRRRPFR